MLEQSQTASNLRNVENSNLVFDVGAHKGEDSDFYLKLGYRVVAIEANPHLAEYLGERFKKEIREGKYLLINRAISESGGTVTFYINKDVSVWGTINSKWAERNKKIGADSYKISVQSVRFSDLVKNYGCPLYLKIDIEGADMLCVNGLNDINCRPKYISIESSKTSWSDLLNEFDVFEKLGYTKFAIIDQRKHKNGKFKTREGKIISYSFEEGATGPFGENLDGIWLSKREAIRRYALIFILYKTIGDNTFLPKLLKHIPILRRSLWAVSWYDTHAMHGDTLR